MSADILTAALGYAANGIPVFPVEPQGKRPLGRLVPHGVKDATLDEDTIRSWWADTPDANVGVATGTVSGLLVVDLDGAEADNAFGSLIALHGPLTADPALPHGGSVMTGNGWHLWARIPPGVSLGNTVSKLGPGIDTRADGGYVLAPPSIHPGGRRYVWVDDPVWPLPEVRPWVVRALEKRRNPGRVASPPSPPATGASAYGLGSLRAELQELTEVGEGARNHRLNVAAFCLGQLVAGGELPEAETVDALVKVGIGIGLTRHEVERTVESGMKAGRAEPRRASDRRAA